MELKLNDILNLSKEEIDNCRIEMNMTAGSGAENFLDKWLKYSDDKKKKGQCTECSYWGFSSRTSAIILSRSSAPS